MSATLSRRSLLATMAAAPVAATPALAGAVAPSIAVLDENPALVAAWKEFRAAADELEAANDALEWLADEWRHLWPLAPEEILGGANAQTNARGEFSAETDIVGSYLLRDCSVLTKRLSREFRSNNERTCFFLKRADEIAERLAVWRNAKPKGRTDKARAMYRRAAEENVRKLEAALPLARAYEAETKRLRELSGVADVTKRITAARRRLTSAELEIHRLPARTMAGVTIKAAALLTSYDSMGLQDAGGILGDAYDLAQAVLAVSEGGVS